MTKKEVFNEISTLVFLFANHLTKTVEMKENRRKERICRKKNVREVK